MNPLKFVVAAMFFSAVLYAGRLPIVKGKVVEVKGDSIIVGLKNGGDVLQSVNIAQVSVFAIRRSRLRELEEGVFWSTLIGAGAGLGASVWANGNDPREIAKNKINTMEKVAIGAGIGFVSRSMFNLFCNRRFVTVFDENNPHRNSPILLKSHWALLKRGSKIRITLK